MTTLSTAISGPISRRVGYALSGLFIAFMLMDIVIKLIPLPIVLTTMGDLGWPPSALVARGLGLLCLVLVVLYSVPQTSVLGAVLLTGYLGGAAATHLRIGDPLFSHVLFGVYLGLFMWGGLYLREARLRALFPVTAQRPFQ